MKKIGILGTGMVGNTIGTRLTGLGYEVRMGSRTANNEKAMEWSAHNGSRASTGTFADASIFGEILFVCLKGEATSSVIRSLNPANVDGKIIVDISNPLDFSKGMPPFLIPDLANTNSLGEEIQRLLPHTHVVKTLNIVNCQLMVTPDKLKNGQPTMLLAGNDPDSKKVVRGILEQFGWDDIIDLGDITAARAMEMMLPVWVRIMATINTPQFGFKVLQ